MASSSNVTGVLPERGDVETRTTQVEPRVHVKADWDAAPTSQGVRKNANDPAEVSGMEQKGPRPPAVCGLYDGSSLQGTTGPGLSPRAEDGLCKQCA